MPYRTIEFVKYARRAAVAGLLLTGAPAAALAQSAPQSAPAPSVSNVSNWTKVCNPQNPAICSVSKDYMTEASPTPLISFAVQTTPDPTKFAVGIQVPLGFVFPPGIPISVDGSKKVTAQYVICLPPPQGQGQGVICLAQAPANADFVTALKKGGKLDLVLTSADAKTSQIELSLSGFSSAFDGPDQGQAAVAKQREEAAKIIQQQAQQRGQQLIDEQRKLKQGGGG